ncbi:MAG: ABC transporter permease [Planctomycetaceae bacterium]|nr:ABC transporter permease [Planctomycetaceae bacterium]
MKGKILGILTVLIVLCTCLAFATSDPWWNLGTSKFLQADNIQNLLNRLSLFGILGIGVAFVIITSGIDLSIGSAVCLCGVLLSILLKVDYKPVESPVVLQVTAAEQTVLLDGVFDTLRPGTTVRYTGGVGSGVIMTVDSVSVAGQQTTVKVQEKLQRNEQDGRLAIAAPIQKLESGDESVVTVPADAEIQVGDQFQLVKADGAVTTQRVTAVTTEGEESRATLAKNPGEKYGSDAFAILLKRHQRTSIPMAIAIVLVVGVLLGFVHGVLVTRVKLQPFVVTLCALLIYRGFSRWLTDDNPAGFGELQQVLGPVASGRVGLAYRGDEMVFGIPIPFFLLTGIGILAAVFLNRTVMGRYLLALGRSEEAARFSGINTSRVTLVAYMICTALAALGGMLFALDNTSVSPSSFGNSYELYAIAAAVLGGCSLRGGEGSIFGVIIGTAVMQVLNNMIMMLKIPQTLEQPVIGTVILIGVLGDELVRRAAAKRRVRQTAG